jgi:hypothetical protein
LNASKRKSALPSVRRSGFIPAKARRFYDAFARCVESVTSRPPAGLLLAGVAFPPVAGNGMAGAGEPFLVAAEIFWRFSGTELGVVADSMTERFQQACPYESGNLAQFKTEKPTNSQCETSRWNDVL